VLVDLMNGIDAFAGRRVEFIHIPVPKTARQDFFVPLRQWRRPTGSHLYLGLLHYKDAEGDLARMAMAREFVPSFGVAAECGFGRTDPKRVPDLLAGHRAAAQALAS
jgi:hypothetical protein